MLQAFYNEITLNTSPWQCRDAKHACPRRCLDLVIGVRKAAHGDYVPNKKQKCTHLCRGVQQFRRASFKTSLCVCDGDALTPPSLESPYHPKGGLRIGADGLVDNLLGTGAHVRREARPTLLMLYSTFGLSEAWT